MTVLARSCRFRMSALRSLTEGKQTCRGHAKIDANDTSMPLKKSQPPPDLVVRSTGEREDHDEGSEGPEWAIRGRASSLSRRASGLSHRRTPDKPYAKGALALSQQCPRHILCTGGNNPRLSTEAEG